MYEIIVVLKALTEVAGVAFLGQGVLWVLTGVKRDQNIVYNLKRQPYCGTVVP